MMPANIEKPILGGKRDMRWQPSAEAHKLMAKIGRYTRFVSITKIMLGALSLLLIGTIIAMPLLYGDKEGIRLAFSGVQEKAQSFPVMTNPTFQGVAENNQPYYVTADSATQMDANQIVLRNVQGDMMTDRNAWLSVKAQQGLINNQTKQMQLAHDVRLMHFDGYEFRTERMDIDMNAKIARGNETISGFGPMGEIKAGGFEWNHDLQTLTFSGRVTLRIQQPHG